MIADPSRKFQLFIDGMVRGAGMVLPGLLIAGISFYARQDFTLAENIMIAGIAALLLFSIIGYSIFYRSLYNRFGRVTLFCFVSWAFLTGVIVRSLSFVDYINTEESRIVNTCTAVFFTLILTYITWWPSVRSFLSNAFTEPTSR